MRENDARTNHHSTLQANLRLDRVRWQGSQRTEFPANAPGTARYSDDFPGSIGISRSEDDRWLRYFRASGHLWHRKQEGTTRARTGVAPRRGSEFVFREPLPARILGWTTAAHWHCPRSGTQSQTRHLR